MVKYFFKKAIDGILPDSIIYRPKQGFRTPVVELFHGRARRLGPSRRCSTAASRAPGFLRRDTLDRACCASTAAAATRSTTATGSGPCSC